MREEPEILVYLLGMITPWGMKAKIGSAGTSEGTLSIQKGTIHGSQVGTGACGASILTNLSVPGTFGKAEVVFTATLKGTAHKTSEKLGLRRAVGASGIEQDEESTPERREGQSTRTQETSQWRDMHTQLPTHTLTSQST